MGGFENQSVWLSELGAVVVALVACALVVWANHGLNLSPIRSILRAGGRSASALVTAPSKAPRVGLRSIRRRLGRSALLQPLV